MPISRSDAALFADETYNMLGDDSKAKRVKQINRRIKKTGYVVDRKNSGRDVLTLVNPETQSVHVAHRGTDLRRFDDLKADIGIAYGATKNRKQFQTRTRKTQKALQDYPDHYASLSGHSYGGTSVYRTLVSLPEEARERIADAQTFNAGTTVIKEADDLSPEATSSLKKKLTHHRVSGDVISASMKVNKPIGKVKTYREKPKSFISIAADVALSQVPFVNLTRGALNAHHMEHFYDKSKYHDEQ